MRRSLPAALLVVIAACTDGGPAQTSPSAKVSEQAAPDPNAGPPHAVAAPPRDAAVYDPPAHGPGSQCPAVTGSDDPSSVDASFGPDNRPLYVGRYSDEAKDGWHCTFWDNGMLQSSVFYEQDVPSGVAHWYREDGSLERKRDYDRKVEVLHHPNGVVAGTGPTDSASAGDWQYFTDTHERLIPGAFALTEAVPAAQLSNPTSLEIERLFSVDERAGLPEVAREALMSRLTTPVSTMVCREGEVVSVLRSGASLAIQPKSVRIRASNFIGSKPGELDASHCAAPLATTTNPSRPGWVDYSPDHGTAPTKVPTGLGEAQIGAYEHDHNEQSSFRLEHQGATLVLSSLERVELFEADIDGHPGPELYLVETEMCDQVFNLYRIRAPLGG